MTAPFMLVVIVVTKAHHMSVQIRIGIPQPSGRLVEAARDANIPVLFSANAFMVRSKDGEHIKSVRLLAPSDYGELDAALDSAGFVAAARYRGYPWSIEQYLDLAQAFPWKWYSSMDLCVEPEIAGSKIDVMFRIAETCRLYSEVSRLATLRGMKKPVPILQGSGISTYLWCVENFPIIEWPELVGVGSMCRRHIHGPNGILSVIDVLDQVLPPHVRLHLFGVKGKALETIGNHPRLHSVDSMAWDFAARREHPVGRTVDVRLDYLFKWRDRNVKLASGPQKALPEVPRSYKVETVSSELEDWLDLVLSNEVEGGDARIHAMREYITC